MIVVVPEVVAQVWHNGARQARRGAVLPALSTDVSEGLAGGVPSVVDWTDAEITEPTHPQPLGEAAPP